LLPRQIAYALCAFYQQSELPKEVKGMTKYLDGFVFSDDRMIKKYDCELHYMQAIADLMMYEYEAAQKAFEQLLADYPASHQEENATYWRASSMLYQQNFEEALDAFGAYTERYPKGRWIASAIFQSGTCLFGMEKYPEAKECFTAVIVDYPDDPVYSDACSLRGDIYGSEAELDKAVADYENAFAKAVTPAQAKYATFQEVKVFDAEKRYEEILSTVSRYLDTYGEEADIAEGIYWIGKTQVNQGKVDEAVDTYVSAIVQYGPDLEQLGVDSMIGELVRLSKAQLKTVERDTLKEELLAAVEAAESQTLQLRLRALLAQMDGAEVELGTELIQELPELDQASPPVLSAISKASFELKDYSRAEEILKAFRTKFEDSEFMRPAYRLRGFDLFTKGEYEEVLKLIQDAQTRYGGEDYDFAWAQIMKGEALAKQGEIKKAVDELVKVLGVRHWRGVIYAEATMKLGEIEEAAGNLANAHNWYQRVYVQYKGYQDGYWAAQGYLAAYSVLEKMAMEATGVLTKNARKVDADNTLRAMLFDKYVNDRPEADRARTVLGPAMTSEIEQMLTQGVTTNLTVTVDAEEVE
jgi:TolA-binding protein